MAENRYRDKLEKRNEERQKNPRPQPYMPNPSGKKDQNSYIFRQLLDAAKFLKKNEDPQIADLVDRIIRSENFKAAEQLLLKWSPELNKQNLDPDHFLSMEKNLEGEFLLGYKEDGRAVGINRGELNRHVFFFWPSRFWENELYDKSISSSERVER